MDIVLVTPNSKVWDPHFNSCAEQEDKFLDLRVGLKHHPEPKQQKIIDEKDYTNYYNYYMEYEEWIDAIISANDCVPCLHRHQIADRR